MGPPFRFLSFPSPIPTPSPYFARVVMMTTPLAEAPPK